MKIPEMKLGKREPTDSVFLKRNGAIKAIITYNLDEILEAIKETS